MLSFKRGDATQLFLASGDSMRYQSLLFAFVLWFLLNLLQSFSFQILRMSACPACTDSFCWTTAENEEKEDFASIFHVPHALPCWRVAVFCDQALNTFRRPASCIYKSDIGLLSEDSHKCPSASSDDGCSECITIFGESHNTDYFSWPADNIMQPAKACGSCI